MLLLKIEGWILFLWQLRILWLIIMGNHEIKARKTKSNNCKFGHSKKLYEIYLDWVFNNSIILFVKIRETSTNCDFCIREYEATVPNSIKIMVSFKTVENSRDVMIPYYLEFLTMTP